jgi:hypothetical protein
MKKLILSVVMCAALIFQANAQDRPMHEIHVAFINNFMKYIQWPTGDKSDFVIGVLGNDEVYTTLKKWYDGKAKGEQKISVKKLASAAEAADCSLVYLSRNKSRDFDDIKTAITGKHCLTITDGNNLGTKGSCLNFKEVDGKLKFELNQSAVAASSLKVSSQLSSIAIVI